MRASTFVSTGLLLGAGFAAGFVVRDIVSRPAVVDEPSSPQVKIDEAQLQAGAEVARALVASLRGDASEEDGSGDSYHRRERTRAEAFAALQGALADGDERRVREALHDLSRGGGERLSSEELAALGGLLREFDSHHLRDLSRAIVMSGGEEGVDIVMAFAHDAGLSLEARMHALEGLMHVPPEHAGNLLPALSDFLESGAPPRLEHTAARAIGELAGDRASSVLLGLLSERPGVRPEVVFDALGDVGGIGDAETLAGMLGGEWSRREKSSLLHAVGQIAARSENAEVLLDMMREPPGGVSRSMVAEAIERSAHHLDAEFLKEALLEASADGRAQQRIARALMENAGNVGLEILLEVSGRADYELDGRALARALGDGAGGEAVPVMMDLLRKGGDAGTLESLARGVFRRGGRESVESLVRLLEGGTAAQRRAVAHGLGEADASALGMDRLVEALRTEGDRDVRSGLARSISRLYGGAGFDEVAGVLRSPDLDREHRHAMMWGLEEALRRDVPAARELFVDLAANNAAPDIRRHAVEIIAHAHDATFVPQLERLLERESHPHVREQIVEAIRRLRDDE